ncbi:protein yellow-like [Neocloeon triangulifer]|uniref:protein yellow-like n=1 Tax=Neocloeon triangulifer TaxID=2078957 RepID=UPI00286EFA77|nr:protein yellow-like [Neocloeon triangulifer]
MCLKITVFVLAAFVLLGAHGYRRDDKQYYHQQGQWRPTVTPANSHHNPNAGFRELFNWKQLDFRFPNEQIRRQAIQSGAFVQINSSMPLSLQADERRLFVSVPRWRQGVPSTLNSLPLPTDLSNAPTLSSPKLEPYPSIELNVQGNCEGVTSVFRMSVDECKRLWVVDTGKVGAQQICPPQIVAFDLLTDTIIYRHRFSESVLRCNSQPTNIAVEYKNANQCGRKEKPDAYLFVTDTAAYAIIVIDTSTERSWRVTDKTMYPAPEAGTFNVAGVQFELMDGIVGLALGPPQGFNGERKLFYNPMSSLQHFWVHTSALKEQNATRRSPQIFFSGKSKRTSQSAGCGIDSRGVLFFGLVNQNALACWDSSKLYDQQNIAVLKRDDETLQFLSTVVVDKQDRIWALSTRFHRFFTSNLNPAEINFRVFTASALTSVRNTPCYIPTLGESQVRGRP